MNLGLSTLASFFTKTRISVMQEMGEVCVEVSYFDLLFEVILRDSVFVQYINKF